MDYCKYADVFYGNGETDHYYSDGLSSKWFYIKALCGNTTPCAVLPFGKISAGPYSGGYPTGYGTHHPNSCGDIRKISDTMHIRGISHLHHSGTGEIGYYYNYAVTTPFYGDVADICRFYPVQSESARPGYYAVTFNGIDCEVTVSDRCAYHHYYFENDGGRVAVDFSNDGLLREFGDKFYGLVQDAHLEVTPFGEVLFTGILSGIRLYFCASVEGVDPKVSLFADGKVCNDTSMGDMDAAKPFGAVFDFAGNSIILKLAYSTIDFEHAKTDVRNSIASFDTVMNKAYEMWNKYLSRVEISTDSEELKQKFYSNLYHSLIKLVDMTGENILCDGYHYGTAGVTSDMVDACTRQELGRSDFKSFVKKGVFEGYTHILDTTDACFVCNVLGLFSVAGSGELLIGSPHIKGAIIHLANGNKLELVVNNLSNSNYYVQSVAFNGKVLTDYKLPVNLLMQGGTLVFDMKKGGDTV